MSVSFAEQVRDRLRARGVVVHENWTNWRNNGNGQTSDYQGDVMHHTATAYGSAFPALVNGRPDLSGPLCNSAGNSDGSVTLVAAHPANHAGAAGGSWARPFPDTNNFNRMVWGHEIVYPGTQPMTDAQFNTMVILGQVICQILNRGPEWIKGHYETSVTGKWDPGFAEGRWYDMNDVRRRIAEGEDDMFTDDDRWFLDDVFEQISGTRDINVVRNLGHYPGFPSWVSPEHSITSLDFTRFGHKNTVLVSSVVNELDGEAVRLATELANQNDEDVEQLLADAEAAALEGVAEGVAEAEVNLSVEVSGVSDES